MATIYAMADIHGFYDEMMEGLNLVDLDSDKENQLIFLGDYINCGPKSYQVLTKLKELELTYPKQVVILIGNHDQMFIDWFREGALLQWTEVDQELRTIKSFFTKKQWVDMSKKFSEENFNLHKMNEIIKAELKKHHHSLIQWFIRKKDALYYETKNQIFVHAGICEVDEELWKYATSDEEFIWKYPAETGSFYKEIIAGHVSTVSVSGNEGFLGRVYWDNESHYFIDGDTPRSLIVPLLKYDTQTKIYSSFEKGNDNYWKEYRIK